MSITSGLTGTYLRNSESMAAHMTKPAAPMNSFLSQRGFTIIEMMVAIMILAIVVTTIYGSFHTILANVERMRSKTREYEMLKDGLNRMVEDLYSIYIVHPPLYEKPKMAAAPNLYRVIGDNSAGGEFGKLRFASSSHLPFKDKDRMGVAEIVYYVQNMGDDGVVLRRKDTLFPYPEQFEEKRSDPILCEKVKSLKFIYYDEEGTEHSYWDSESMNQSYATPSAIKIQLETGSENESLKLSVKVKLSTFRQKIE